jgi:O-antigen ligase
LLVLLAVLVAVRGDVGLMLIVLAIPWAPLHKTFGPLRFSCLEIITLLTVAGQLRRELVASVARWRQGQRPDPSLSALWSRLWRTDALDLGMVALLTVSFLSLAASEWLRVSLRELRVVVLQAAFVYWLILRLRPGRNELLRLADLFVLSVVAFCLHGLGQYLWTEDVIVAEGVRRMRSIYGSPNNLALLLDRTLPLLLAVTLWGTVGRRRLLYAVAALLASICLFLTFSRAAWLFGLTAGVLALALLAGRRGWLVAAGLVIAGLMALLPIVGTARFSSLLSLQGTTLLRIKLWEAAWEMARDHPLWGVGLDNFLYQYPRYIRPEALSEPNLSHPHNVFLDVWLRLGVPGLAAFAWLEWAFFRRAFSVWKRRADPELWAVGVGLMAGMIALLAHGLVDAALFVVELAALWAFILGLLRRLTELVKH